MNRGIALNVSHLLAVTPVDAVESTNHSAVAVEFCKSLLLDSKSKLIVPVTVICNPIGPPRQLSG
jgi:hypothetical protein